jgi:translation initiation factor 5B
MLITAGVLAEICSALPLSGSIYIWAAESAGPKYARFVGFIVAWWSCTAWMTFAAGNCQVCYFSFLLAQISNQVSDYSQLYRLSTCGLGNRFPWWNR